MSSEHVHSQQHQQCSLSPAQAELFRAWQAADTAAQATPGSARHEQPDPSKVPNEELGIGAPEGGPPDPPPSSSSSNEDSDSNDSDSPSDSSDPHSNGGRAKGSKKKKKKEKSRRKKEKEDRHKMRKKIRLHIKKFKVNNQEFDDKIL